MQFLDNLLCTVEDTSRGCQTCGTFRRLGEALDRTSGAEVVPAASDDGVGVGVPTDKTREGNVFIVRVRIGYVSSIFGCLIGELIELPTLTKVSPSLTNISDS
jgi:hypothetical protein